jgi:ferrous iron transport protein A
MAVPDTPVRIVALRAGRGLDKRLAELGLNVGCVVRVVQRHGGKLLVARGETRLAVGGGLATRILVQPETEEPR